MIHFMIDDLSNRLLNLVIDLKDRLFLFLLTLTGLLSGRSRTLRPATRQAAGRVKGKR
jgi:hypothetical protein